MPAGGETSARPLPGRRNQAFGGMARRDACVASRGSTDCLASHTPGYSASRNEGYPCGRNASFAGKLARLRRACLLASKAPAHTPFDRLRAGRQARGPPPPKISPPQVDKPADPTGRGAPTDARPRAAGCDGPPELSPQTARFGLDYRPSFAACSTMRDFFSLTVGVCRSPSSSLSPNRPLIRK